MRTRENSIIQFGSNFVRREQYSGRSHAMDCGYGPVLVSKRKTPCRSPPKRSHICNRSRSPACRLSRQRGSQTWFRSASNSTERSSGSGVQARHFSTPRKVRSVMAGNHNVALVVDDLVSFDPFIARFIRVYGLADPPVERVGMVGPGSYLRITPTMSWSWNMAGEQVGDTWYQARRTVHRIPPRA